LEEKTQKEFDRLTVLYPTLSHRFRKIVLNSMKCIEMPFFKPVMKKDRLDALQEIEMVYRTHFARKRLKYAEDDIRWRHVGTLPGEKEDEIKYYLFDVADLLEDEHDVDEQDVYEQDVDDQDLGEQDVRYLIQKLTDRIGTKSENTSSGRSCWA
jgi:hypothetical protein